MTTINEIKNTASRYNVLCVDDEEKSRVEIEGLLKLFFKNVYTAANGKEGLDVYYKNPDGIDIIFTDIFMPLMDGIQMSSHIKDSNPLQHIVAISAHQDPKLYLKCINSGINGMIIKPITSTKLVEILSNALNKLEYLKKKELINTNNHPENSIKTETEIYFDDITGLNNKHYLDRYLLGNKIYWVIVVNIDNFDQVNTKYGYKTGDQILKQLAKVLKSLCSSEFKLFRVVSDEFAFLTPNNDSGKIEELAKQIIVTMENTKLPTDVDDIHISCTVGISFGSGQEVLRQGHIAIKEARQIGKEKFNFYSKNSKLKQKQEDNLKWLKKIKKSLKEDCVIPYYQPVIDNKTNKVHMYESLARILEVNRVVRPYYFLENAKLFNLMPHITKLMVKNVFKYMKEKKCRFSINISQDDLLSSDFIKYIIETAQKHDLENEKIVFELNETITTVDDKNIINNLDALQKRGFKIAIDDFGMTNTNINLFHSIDFEYIKIDSVLIENMLDDKRSLDMVKYIIDFASSIKAKIIAESVSSKEIFEKVRELKIDYSQGYHIQRPKEFI